MKLNWIGRAAMNSRARTIGQSYVASLFGKIGGRLDGGAALEVGCGGGYGVEIILKRFAANSVHALDLDPEMLEVARQRLVGRDSSKVHLSQGNVTSIHTRNETFDAVFDFGAIHLEPNWRQALAEVARVLRPGGRYYFEVVTSRGLRLTYPLLSEGFRSMQPPSVNAFLGRLQRVGQRSWSKSLAMVPKRSTLISVRCAGHSGFPGGGPRTAQTGPFNRND